ncbi:MAG: 6-phosphogluconolactonase [Gemmatimonadaceae bacterium]
MPNAPVRVFATPDAIGEEVAGQLLQRIGRARSESRRFLLGSPTGRSPKPVFAAMARRLAAKPQELGHVVFVMMDEYLVRRGEALVYAPGDAPWSCHWFGREEIARPLNASLAPKQQLRAESIWFPDPEDPPAYDARIEEAGGIDYFLLASGASDGHVAFNPPGSPRTSRTRIIELSEETRRDNLKTFPAFGTLDAVPHHGVSVGIETITRSREAAMIAWGAGKRLTVARMRGARGYEPDWPATLIHECVAGQILCDEAAAQPA